MYLFSKKETTPTPVNQGKPITQENAREYVYFLPFNSKRPEQLNTFPESRLLKRPNAVAGAYYSEGNRRIIAFDLIGYFTANNEWVARKPDGYFIKDKWFPDDRLPINTRMDSEVRKRVAIIKYVSKRMVQEDYLDNNDNEARIGFEKALIRLYITSDIQVSNYLFLYTIILLWRVDKKHRRDYDAAQAFTALAILANKYVYDRYSRSSITLPSWNKALNSGISDKRLADIERAMFGALGRNVHVREEEYKEEVEKCKQWFELLNQNRKQGQNQKH